MTTPSVFNQPIEVDINRLKLKIKVGLPTLDGRPSTGEYYLDNFDQKSLLFTRNGPVRSEWKEQTVAALASEWICDAFYENNSGWWRWFPPDECRTPSRTGTDQNRYIVPSDKLVIEIVEVPPLPPTPEPTPTPTETPEGPPSPESVADLPPTDDPVLIQQQKDARSHIESAKKTEEDLKTKTKKIDKLKATLKMIAPQVVAAVVTNNVKGSAAATIGQLAGSFTNLALQGLASKMSASNAQAEAMSSAVTQAVNDQKNDLQTEGLPVDENLPEIDLQIDNEQITSQIDADIAQFTSESTGE